MHAPQELDLTISDVAHGGIFVARHEGRVIFVSDAIPGETVRARVSDDSKASFWRAETIEVLEASPHRQAHVWSAADVAVSPALRPGGAEFGHITLEHQRELKTKVLRDSLARFAKIDSDVSVAGVGGQEDGTRWRTRVSLHVDGAGRIGPYAARSHNVIEVNDLPLATAAIERAADKLYGDTADRIDLIQAADGHVRVLNRTMDDKGQPVERQSSKREVLIERVGEREFRVDADGFWQVHHDAATTLDAAVRRALQGVEIDPNAWNLDLYGGVGLFAATVAELGGTRVTSVESNARATEHAGENLSEWIGARVETARVDRYTRSLLSTASERERARLRDGVVVIDPPRAGAGKNVVSDLANLAPRAIVYVACDPVALARDLGTFAERGYQLAGIEAFDLFPHSHHLETVALLQQA